MSQDVAYHRYTHRGQYAYKVEKGTPARIRAGDRIVADEQYLPRSDDRFLIENAGRMLELLCAIDAGDPLSPLHKNLRDEIQNMIGDASLSGIDVIALGESS